MKSRGKHLVFALGLGLTLLLVLSAAAGLGGGPPVAQAQGPDGYDTYYVAADGDCGAGYTPCYANVQDAVDAVDAPNDVVKVAAGVYADMNYYGGLAQVVYISKSLTIRGGYTTTNWTTPDPVANPTTLDARGLGRVLVITGTITPTVEGLRITGGNARGLGGGPSGWDAGGGAYVYEAPATISNCVIYSNTATTRGDGSGGGLYLYYSDATLVGNTVRGNTATTSISWGRGGGLCLWYSNATLEGNTVQGNTASTSWSGWGGGLYLYYSDATLVGNTVQGNIASTGYSGSGGGLYIERSDATVSGNTVVSNTASTADSGSGGGVHLHYSGATLTGNTIINNTASTASDGSGGGVHVGVSDATLVGNTVQGNIASTGYSGSGGGLCLSGGTPTLEGNTVQGNIASTTSDGEGGGVNICYYSAATLRGNTIVSNTATLSPTASGQGGGLRVWLSDSFILTNNLLADNHANTQGSGLYFQGSSTYPTSGRLLHTTIAHNRSSGQGVYVGEYTSLVFTNTIIAGHLSVGITVTTGSTVALEATLWYNNGSDTGGEGYISTGTVNVYDDPAFVAPSAWDYHLTAGSAAIDAGVDVGVTTDIDGDPRPIGPKPDIGADEYAVHVYLPLVLRGYAP